MTAFIRRRRILSACLAVAVAAGAWWAYDRATRPLTAAEVLATIPEPAGGSATDKLVATWAERAGRDRDSTLVWTNLADALMQKARESMDTAYYGRAEAAFARALALNAKNVSAMAGLAWVHGARHEFEESIEWAREALDLDPNHHDAHGLLGDAAVELGDYDAAYKHYQKMLDIRPDLSSYSRGAHLLFLTGDTRKALWLMDKAINAGAPHGENTAWCRAQLAAMLWHTGALLPAEQTVEIGLARAPSNYHLLVMMGRIKTARGDHEAAIDAYRKAMAAVPQHEVVVALGDLYLLMGRRDDAERQFSLVETIHASNVANGVHGSLELARFYADHDRHLTEAVTIAEREHKTRPNVVAADTLAWAYYKTGRYEDARRLIGQALARGTPNAGFLFHAGMIHEKLGHRGDAKQYLYRALSLNPHFHPLDRQVAADTLARLGG
jgi:tetratricopeptide (TPR) repeat protein